MEHACEGVQTDERVLASIGVLQLRAGGAPIRAHRRQLDPEGSIMSIPNAVRVVEPCPECGGAGFIDHPAWAAVWGRRANPARLYDWEVALTMCVAGFADDVIVAERDAEGMPRAYTLPDRLIPCDCLGPEPEGD